MYCVRVLASKNEVGKVLGKLQKPDFSGQMTAEPLGESPNLKRNVNYPYALRFSGHEFMEG